MYINPNVKKIGTGYVNIIMNAASLHFSPTKSTFIKAKYQRLAFVPRLPCKDDDTITVSDLSQVTYFKLHVDDLCKNNRPILIIYIKILT